MKLYNVAVVGAAGSQLARQRAEQLAAALLVALAGTELKVAVHAAQGVVVHELRQALEHGLALGDFDQ